MTRLFATNGTARIKTLTLFRSNYMDNPLPLITEAKVCEPISFDIIFQRQTLKARVLFFNELLDILEILPRRCGYVMIGCLAKSRYESHCEWIYTVRSCWNPRTETSYSEGTIRAADSTASIAKALECLWGSNSAKALGQLSNGSCRGNPGGGSSLTRESNVCRYIGFHPQVSIFPTSIRSD